MLPLLAASALVAAPLVLAVEPSPSGNGINSIKCQAIAIGDTSTYSKDAFVDLGVEYAGHICGDGDAKAAIEVTYNKIAAAIAKAVATTYVECVTEGKDVYGEAEAYSHAETSTEAYAEALGTGWGSVETCYGCYAAAELFVASSKELFAEATATARSKLKVYGEASGAQKFAYAYDVVKTIEKHVAVTYANIAIEIEAAVDRDAGTQNCKVKVQGCTKTGDEGGCCELEVSSAGSQVSTIAIAEAAGSAEAIAYSCGEEYTEEESVAYATAVAYAFAEAVSAADGYCYSTDRSSACAWGGTSVEAFAYAQAYAFAEAWAVAANGCNCNIEVATTADAFTQIFLSAHSSLETEICTDGGLAGTKILQRAYADETLEAIASALATAYQDNKSCAASASGCAETGGAYDYQWACCEVSLDNYPVNLSKDAYAEAITYAGSFSCATEDAEIEAQSKLFVSATAKAIAQAVIEVNKWCTSSEYAGFCSFLEGSITAHATAQAKAFASAWAGTGFDCDCKVSAESITSAVKDIFVKVTASVHEGLCVYGEAFDVNTDTILKEVQKEETALAAAFAQVKSDGENCVAVVGTGTETTPDPDADPKDVATPVEKDEKCKNDCVRNTTPCWRKGGEVSPCCDETRVCVTQTPHRAVCKKLGSRAHETYKRMGYGEVKHCAGSA